ncbi:hypothetical protein HYFRA_00007235 [Hymenoscyphus fraxineus]|uniref:AA1-like domain-containing protein n=1 Tax=Hymenoscyphus fraxineus TaxID=746836 RepID=A0A9N9PJ07_9HELO|nr:hypothetical protein HYFRA_00007235 [Hymenoscyphus fraxineus]
MFSSSLLFSSFVFALSFIGNCGARNVPKCLRPPIERRSETSLDLKDFSISNVTAHTFVLKPSITTWNRTLSFLFTDLNSNTSTICTQSWSETSASKDPTTNTTIPMTNNAPSQYVLCDYTGIEPDYFQWRFVSSYTTFGNFEIALAHTFRDDVNFEPPYDVPTFFATSVKLDLTCVDGDQCILPACESPLLATVDAIND